MAGFLESRVRGRCAMCVVAVGRPSRRCPRAAVAETAIRLSAGGPDADLLTRGARHLRTQQRVGCERGRSVERRQQSTAGSQKCHKSTASAAVAAASKKYSPLQLAAAARGLDSCHDCWHDQRG